MLSLLSGLIAQAAKVAGKTKVKGPPAEKDVWYYIDTVNEWLSHPDFHAATQNPYFWGGSVLLMVVALFRGWKFVLIGYPIAIVMWGIVDKYVLQDTGAAGAGDSNVIVFAGLTVGVAGLGIYFLLIRD